MEFFDQNNYDTLIEIPWKNFRRALKLTEERPSVQESKVKKYMGELDDILSEFRYLISKLEEIAVFSKDKEIMTPLNAIHRMIDELSALSDKFYDTKDPSILEDIERTLLPYYVSNFEDVLGRLRPRRREDTDMINILRRRLARVRSQIQMLSSSKEISHTGAV
jgi:hypothetical protein